MSCRNETIGSLAYRFCPDPVPVAADRVRAVMSVRLIDELTGEPVELDIGLSTPISGLYPRVARGGLVGLVGRPAQLFPDLDMDPVSLSMQATAPRYLPVAITGTLGPIAGFPQQFAPLAIGNMGLHRVSTTLRGRTLRRAGLTQVVVAGATVEIVGYWPSFPPANVDPAAVMEPPNLLALSPPFYAPRTAGSTRVQRRDWVPVAGQEAALLLPAVAGETRLRLSNRIGLGTRVPLIVDRNDSVRRERILIDEVEMDSTDDQPAWVRLTHPLAHTHLDEAFCQPANLLPAGVPNSLIRAAIPGDETVFLNALAGLVSGDTVEVDDSGGKPEYHEVEHYREVSDGNGYFHLPPIARVAMVTLHAERVGLVSPQDERFTPDYRLAENRLTVVFP